MPIKFSSALLVILVLWLGSIQTVKAAIIEDLYDAKIAVDDQSERTQNRAFSQALNQVLVKVRGSNDLLANPKIKNALKRATRFVRSYSYVQQEAQLFILINFDPQRVENIIRSSGFPVWDKRRPESIVWLAIQPSPNSARQIARQTDYTAIYQQLNVRAAQRGISLVFPLWDLQDIQALAVYDIWGGFSSQISEASERYAVSSVVSARIYLNNLPSEDLQERLETAVEPTATWSADWTMIEGNALFSGQVQGDSQLKIADNIIDVLADRLSTKYAVDLSTIDRTDSSVQIVVNNVDSIIYYNEVLKTLENMSVVNDVTLLKQQGSRATFELDLLGDVEDLTNALNLDNKINPVVDEFGQPLVGLEYFWAK